MSELFYSLFILSLSFFQENWSWFWNQKGIFKDNYYYYFFFFQKENLPSSLQELPLSVLLSWVFAAFVCPLLSSQSPWSVCPSSHTVLPQASYPCAHVIGSESLWQKRFPFQGGLWVSAQKGLQSWQCIKWGGAGETSFTTAIWAGSSRTAGGGKLPSSVV